jgi:hypothetical protein
LLFPSKLLVGTAPLHGHICGKNLLKVYVYYQFNNYGGGGGGVGVIVLVLNRSLALSIVFALSI